MAAPVVNVIIANHNYGKWIGQAINSVLAQDYPSKIITIVDDGSSDNSIEEIGRAIGHSIDSNHMISMINKTRVEVIRLDKPTGPSNARNVAIDATIEETDIYAILDADDEFLPGKLSRCVAEMQQQDLIGVVYADYVIEHDETGKRHIEYKQSFSHQKLMRECIIHSGSLIRKQALIDAKDEFGYYDVNMRTCEDYDLWIRISNKYTICHVAEPLTLVRVHSDNSTNSVDNSIWQQNWNRISQKLRGKNQ